MNGQKINDVSAWSLHEDQNTVVAFQPSKTNPNDVTWASLCRANTGVSGELDGKVRAVDPAIAVPTELSGRLDKYRIKNCIGEGASGKVYAGEVACQSGRLASVALKVISRDRLTEGSKSLILSELKVIKALTESEFQHAIHLKEAFHDAQNCYLVTDLARLGSLSDIMKRSTFDVDRVRFTMAVLIQAIDGLHKRGIIHRDIKPGNILFGEDGYPLLGDFGIARQFSLCMGAAQPDPKTIEFLSKFQDVELTIGRCGTHGYMAPEILRGKAYSYGVDVFSLGVVFYQMLHRGQLPFTGGSLQDLIDAELCSAHHVDDEDRSKQPEAFDLLDKLLEKLPANRIDVEAAKRHPYFEDIDWELIDEKAYRISFGWYCGSQVQSSTAGRNNVTMHKSTLIGERVLASQYDPELHGFDVRTLPIEPREWGLMRTIESNVQWPRIVRTPVSGTGPEPTEDSEPSNIKPSNGNESDLSGGISSQLLDSIPCPEDEEDEDYLDYDDPCIQKWAGDWKSTYEGRLGSSSSLSGLGGTDDEYEVEGEMETDIDAEDEMEVDMDVDVDGGEDVDGEDEETDDGTVEEDEVMVEVLIGGLDDTDAMGTEEEEEEKEEMQRVSEWMENWDAFTRSRLGKNAFVSTERDPIVGLGAGHPGFDEDGNRIASVVHASEQDCDTVNIETQPWNADGLAAPTGLTSILKKRSSLKPKKRVRFALPDEPKVELHSILKRKQSTSSLKPKKCVRFALLDEPKVELRSILKRKQSTGGLKSEKRVHFALPDEEIAQAGAMPVSSSSAILASEPENPSGNPFSWIKRALFSSFDTTAKDCTSWKSNKTRQDENRQPFKPLVNMETSWINNSTSTSDMVDFDSFSF